VLDFVDYNASTGNSPYVGYAANNRSAHVGRDGFSVYRGSTWPKSDFMGRIARIEDMVAHLVCGTLCLPDNS
jgi:hypothetical protein